MSALRDFMVRAALVCALALPVYYLAAVIGVRLHLMDWRVGYAWMSVRLGPFLMLAAAALAAVALALAFGVAPRRGRCIAVLALTIPLVALGYRAVLARQAVGAPPLHDISTDVTDPPGFSADVAAARAATPGANPLTLVGARLQAGAFAGRRAVTVQQQTYPDIQPVIAAPGPARTYALALETARALHWRIGAEQPGRQFEAQTRSFWFGLVDDIVVRVRANPPGAIVDIRDSARVGDGADGAGGQRVRAFTAALKEKLAMER